LSLEQRAAYYTMVCKSLKLNPLTRPFEYIWFQSHENAAPRLTLYATKNCTDQLRKLHKVSIVRVDSNYDGVFCVATAEVKDKTGRTDVDTGVVFAENMRGQELGNAKMWSCTKAKRRATLSICGLGMLDESELPGLPSYRLTTPGGRQIEELSPAASGHEETQEEVLARKMAAYTPKLTWKWFNESQTARIEGSPVLLEKQHDLLRRFWSANAGGFVANTDQLEWLRIELGERGVPFEEVKV
jgi:hypothetical protein